MQTEQCRNQGTGPNRSGYSIEKPKKQEAVYCMQNQAGGMMHAGIQSVNLTIQHMGYPCQREPVGSTGGTKGPDDPFYGQSLLNMRIFRHVLIIIKVDKVI